jgi:hypothetical protein
VDTDSTKRSKVAAGFDRMLAACLSSDPAVSERPWRRKMREVQIGTSARTIARFRIWCGMTPCAAAPVGARTMRRRALVGSFGALTLAVVAMVTGTVSGTAQTATPAAQPGDVQPGRSGCAHPVPVQAVEALHGDGTRGPAVAGDHQGRVYHFGRPGTTDIQGEQVEPPTGFNPLTASDAELQTYGFEARPKDPGLMEHWRSLYANYRAPSETEVPSQCSADEHDWWVGTDYQWGGAVNNAAPPEGYWQSQVGFTQTAFDSVCPGASGYSTWTGLGGYYYPQIAQAGTTADHSSLNGVFNFWDVGAPTNPPSQYFGIDRPVPGDSIYASVNNNNSASITFRIIKTNAPGWNDSYTFTGAGGYPASAFIDATVADFINEAPGGGPAPGGNYYFRKPHLNNTWLFWEYADEHPMENFQRFGLDLASKDNSHWMQHIETYPPTPGWTGTQNFYNQWVACA